MPTFGSRSQAKLATCHPDLIRLFNRVVEVHDCTVLEGHRSKARQEQAFYDGNSEVTWPNSRHNTEPSEAIDVMPWYDQQPHVRWNMNDWQTKEELYAFADLVKQIAAELEIDVEWGGEFKSFFDGPHWQLRRP